MKTTSLQAMDTKIHQIPVSLLPKQAPLRRIIENTFLWVHCKVSSSKRCHLVGNISKSEKSHVWPGQPQNNSAKEQPDRGRINSCMLTTNFLKINPEEMDLKDNPLKTVLCYTQHTAHCARPFR